MSDVLFFSVSGQRFTDRSNLYGKLKKQLPELFPGERFGFLGNPFWHLPFPLLWNEKERERHASTRLLDCWTRLDDFCCQKLLPAFQTTAIVLTDGFGLDSVLYSTALISSKGQNEKAFLLHDSLIAARLKVEEISAPTYLITRADAPTVDAKMCQNSPALAKLNLAERYAFIQHEERTIKAYFERIGHQKTPHYINAGLSIDAKTAAAIDIVRQHVKNRNQQKAACA